MSQRHRKTVRRGRYAEIWECSCSFMTWKARAGLDRLARRRALDAAWNSHLTRRRLRRVK